MNQHHSEAIEAFVQRYKTDTTILAILLGGSIAHGFSDEHSDVDILLIVTPQEYERRKAENNLTFPVFDICTHEGCYIDCKVVDLRFIELVLQKGSDPSRYAFKGCRILFSRIENIEALLHGVSAFPEEQLEERRLRFTSQLLAWKWYYSEGLKKKNNYLINLSTQKVILFSVRILLNENHLLYPFHKWMFKELEGAPHKPENISADIEDLLAEHNEEKVSALCSRVLNYLSIDEESIDWANYFIKDSEHNWMGHGAPIDDI